MAASSPSPRPSARAEQIAEAYYTTPLRVVAPEWLDSTARQVASGAYGDVAVDVERQQLPELEPILHVRVARAGTVTQEIELAPHQLVPLWLALQGAIAAAQGSGLVPVRSRADLEADTLTALRARRIPRTGAEGAC
jgi:hypothetical protein